MIGSSLLILTAGVYSRRMLLSCKSVGHSTHTKFIKNIDIPSCKNCIYHRPYIGSTYSSSLSQCHKFGTKNFVDDKITYSYADATRSDEEKCGREGKYFENDEQVKYKIVKHVIVNNIPFTFSMLLPFVSIFLLYK